MPKPSYLVAGLACASLVFSLSACSKSNFLDRTADYHTAEKVSNRLPASYAEADLMPLTEPASRPQKSLKDAPRPESLRVASEEELVTERVDAQGTWLLIMRSPSEVWTSLRDFVENQDLPLETANPKQGELVLAADAASRLPAQHFQLRQGVRRGSAEIHLNSYADGQRLAWSTYDSNRLQALAQHLKISLLEDDLSVSLQAQSLQDQRLVRLVDRDERQVLELSITYERAWAEILNLLEDEFNDDWQKLEDVNRTAGLIYVRYVPVVERPKGFWARLFAKKPKEGVHLYQLALVDYHPNIDVTLETTAGQPAPESVERELLAWLERQLR